MQKISRWYLACITSITNSIKSVVHGEEGEVIFYSYRSPAYRRGTSLEHIEEVQALRRQEKKDRKEKIKGRKIVGDQIC